MGCHGAKTVTVFSAEIGFDVSSRTLREDFKGDVDGTNFSANGDHGKGFENNADTTRTNTVEHNKILNERNSSTGALTDIGPIPVAEDSATPYCVLDNFDVAVGAAPVCGR